jgi:pimeloyl-ACP methyl ester carboxylesterase
MFVGSVWAPVTDLGEEFRRAIKSEIPTLILVGDLDPRTPLVNAREIAITLPAAKIVVLENATHQFDLFGSSPIRAVLGQFLRGGAVTTDTLTFPLSFFSELRDE